MKKDVFETPIIEVVMIEDNEIISTGHCCGDGHTGD